MRYVSPLFVIAMGIAVAARAQPAQQRRIVGTGISGGFEMTGAPGTIGDTARLVFPGGGAPEFTVDFTVQYQAPQPLAPPAVVDMVITQYVSGDDRPGLSLQIDGTDVELHPRL